MANSSIPTVSVMYAANGKSAKLKPLGVRAIYRRTLPQEASR